MFEGILMSESIPNGRKAGNILVTPSALIFKSNELEEVFPLRNIVVKHGGAAGRLLYFTHPDKAGFVLQTGDLSILKHPDLEQLHGIKDAGRSVKKHKITLGSVVLGTLTAIAILVAAFYIFRGAIIKSIAMKVPMTYQEQIGRPMFESTLKTNRVLKSDTLDQYIQELTLPLLTNLKDTSYHFTFAVIEEETINAFALPGGYVVIHSALLEKAESPDEVAGVLAHEISHVTCRHHLRGLFNRVGTFYVLGMFFGDISLVGDLINMGASLESLTYSRNFESESDMEGLKLALGSGYTADGFVNFFKKLKEEYGESSLFANYLSTHPNSSDRISAIESQAERLTLSHSQPEFFIPYQTFKDHLNKLLEN